MLCNKVPYPAHDGSSIAIKSMVEGLLHHSAAVSMLCINTSKHYRAPERTQAHLPKGLHYEALYHNNHINVRNAGANLFSRQPFQVSRFFFAEFAERLKAILQEEAYDWVQLEGLAMATYLPLIRRCSKARVALRAHNVEHEIWQRHLRYEKNIVKQRYLRLQTRRLRKMEQHTAAAVDAVIAITERDRERFAQWQPALRTLTVPCGLNPGEYGQPSGAPIYDLGCLASFDWLPNQQGMLWFAEQVWPLLKQERPGTTLACAGRAMPPALHKLSQKGIRVLGEVDNLPHFLAQCRVLIVPLLAGGGMRIKILENMAYGQCMVATSVGAEGIDLKPGRDILLADTPEDFARQTAQLLRNPKKQKALGAAARKVLETKYSHEKLAQKLLKFYENPRLWS